MRACRSIRFRFLAVAVLACTCTCFAAAAIAADEDAEAEVHVIGLYEAAAHQHFRLMEPHAEGVNWARFCRRLVELGKQDALTPSKRLWELLPADTRELAADAELIDVLEQVTKLELDRRLAPAEIQLRFGARRQLRSLANAIEAALERPDFYQKEYFTELQLDDPTRARLDKLEQLPELERRVVHRRLLEAAFPDSVRKQPFSIERATVPVRVAATGKPIILVLSAYESVNWSIELEPGAKLRKVIVGGYHLQQVEGTDVPVEYHVYEQRQPGQPSRHFHAYRRDDENYPKLVDAVRELTGRGISTFQGRYRHRADCPLVAGREPPNPEEDGEDESVDKLRIGLGTVVRIIHSGPPGSTWDEPPAIEVVERGRRKPVEFVRLTKIEDAEFWIPSTPVLVFVAQDREMDEALERMKRPRPDGAPEKQFVVWQFRAVDVGSATITMTRRDAKGEKKNLSAIIEVLPPARDLAPVGDAPLSVGRDRTVPLRLAR